MEALGRAARREVRVHLVGGATAVLLGWRGTTIDVDFVMDPEDDALLRAIPALKEELHINVELASPADFIPLPPGWQDRGTFVTQVGKVGFFHFDLYGQALAKVERGHRQDLADVREMIARRLVDGKRALEYFARIEPELYRFPAIDPPSFRQAVEDVFAPDAR
jgi:hypothetical protein